MSTHLAVTGSVHALQPEDVRSAPRWGIIQTVTLLVALQGKDGIVLAADSRGTFGDPREVTAQNDSQQKAHVLSQHVAVLQAGAAEAATILGRTRDVLAGGLLLQQLPGNAAPTILHAPEPPLPRPDFVLPSTPDGVTPVMETLRQTSRASYYEWFPSVPAMQAPGLAAAGQAPVRPDVQLLVAGYEIEPGITDPVPRLYSMTSQWDFAPARHDYGFAVGGIPTYALYLLNRLYQGDRSLAELTALAVYTITETASQDGKVGGPPRVVQITFQDGCSPLDASQVQQIVAENDERSAALRNSFYNDRGGDDARHMKTRQPPNCSS